MIGIYKLVFPTLEDWPYVGQSRNIEARYRSHCLTLARGIGNKKMLDAYEISGPPEVYVLEECKEEDLNTRERHWIRVLDSQNNGLNNSPGGDIYFGSGVNHYNSKYSREQIIEGMTLLQNPQQSLAEAAKLADMSVQALYSVKAGITHQWFQEEFPDLFVGAQADRRKSAGYDHQRSKFTKEQILKVFQLLQDSSLSLLDIAEKTGVSTAQINGISRGRTHLWLQDEFPKEFILIQNINRHLHCTYEDASVILVSPEGREFQTEGEGGAAFAKSIGETSAFATGINSVMSGKARQYKGWTLKGNELSTYTLLSPIGTVEVLKNRSEFCKKFQISRQSLSALLNGKQKSVLGWTILKKE